MSLGREITLLLGLQGYLDFLFFLLQVASPTLSPFTSILKTSQTVHKPLFICLSVVIAHVINCTRAFLAL